MDWMHLGGYGVYVWPAYGGSLLLMAWELIALRRQAQQALRHEDTDLEGDA
jgi:heme exporter protein CcmD